MIVAIVVVLVLVVMVVLRRRYLVVTVRGHSMGPTYRPGDKVLVRRVAAAAVRRGQAVVFKTPTGGATDATAAQSRAWEEEEGEVFDWDVELLIKRAVATGGDRVGFPVPGGPTVPAGHLAVRGDNAKESFDSRHFGYVSPEWVVGVVVRRLGAA
ncbi:S26 family signal peptidase [Nonomuraea sp. NPDC005650]|uniref:S26 family signal peptidase n=1 Tax=Nonomuraea sp. NPDC005650 TaxID=3157045 RepID=UPI0033A1D14C